uniref:SSD domain-containing protein n=1 Tax=Sinocyclocheilus grahami TaxID=75366 RepID=A0A672TFC8_SINGR
MSYFRLLKVLASAQHEPGYCSFYEDCGLNPAVEGALIPPRVPCKDYRKAVNVTGDHYELFKSVCPMLAHGEGETLACCSIRQLTALQSSLTLSKAVLIRCPSCADNFAHIHCVVRPVPVRSQDCEQSCPAVPQPPPLPKPFMNGRLDGVLVISIIIFSYIFFLIMCYVVLECTIHIRKSKASLATQEFLGSLFQAWGTIMARYPLIVLPVYIELTTDPVQLWSAPESRAMREKAFHDAHFDPFYRTNHHYYNSLLFGEQNFSGIISKDLIIELLELQQKIQAIEFWSDELNRSARLKDVCYAPLNPGNPSLTDCAVNSLPQYFQNSIDNLNAKANMTELGVTKKVDWRDHFIYCVNSPLSFKDITALGMSCMADYCGPVFPFLAEYTTAEALILTFSLNNYTRTDVKFKVVEEWERRFLKFVQEYQKNTNTNVTFAYMAERSLEDEINRTTAEDIPIFMISYAVDSKFLVGLGGILVVGCSVMASMGFYAWIGVPSSLVILQVVPFLVLAVGADNIFIFVLE